MANNVVDIIIKANDQTGGALTKLNTAFKGLTGFSLSAAGGIAAAGTAISKLYQFVKDSVDETEKYVTSITDLSRVLGMTTEDTSRLVQASDDLFISQEKLTTAMLAASRQGIDTSVNGLKKLSEEYLNLAPGVDRAQFLMQKFGRSGADMGKLMEIGADGIDKAMASISDSLVVTKQSREDIIKYKQAIDNLNDSWQGVKYTIGEVAIPALVRLADMIQGVYKEVENADNAVLTSMGGFNLTARQIEKYGININNLSPAMEAWRQSLIAQGEAFQALEPEIQGTTDALGNLSDQYSSVTSLAKSLQINDEALLTAETNLAEYIKTHPWDKKGIEDRKQAVSELKEEQVRMVDQWMVDVFQKMLMADGALSDSEMAFLLQFQVDTGLISEENAKRAQSYYDQAARIIGSNDAITNSVNRIPTSVTTFHTTVHQDVYMTSHVPTGHETTFGGGYAVGGYAAANTPILVGENGPEVFTPSGGGQITPNGQLGNMGGSQFDMTQFAQIIGVVVAGEIQKVTG